MASPLAIGSLAFAIFLLVVAIIELIIGYSTAESSPTATRTWIILAIVAIVLGIIAAIVLYVATTPARLISQLISSGAKGRSELFETIQKVAPGAITTGGQVITETAPTAVLGRTIQSVAPGAIRARRDVASQLISTGGQTVQQVAPVAIRTRGETIQAVAPTAIQTTGQVVQQVATPEAVGAAAKGVTEGVVAGAKLLV